MSKAFLLKWKLSVFHWLSLVDAIHSTINQSLLERLDNWNDEKARCPMEVFTGMKLATLLILSKPLIQYKNLAEIREA